MQTYENNVCVSCTGLFSEWPLERRHGLERRSRWGRGSGLGQLEMIVDAAILVDNEIHGQLLS